MIKEFIMLREDEVEVLFNAPIYVAILIAGADGKIDTTERREAIETARAKQSRAREQLEGYYKEVSEGFEEKFDKLLGELPAGTEERTQAIIKELRKLNFILPKIEKRFAIKLYGSLKDLAKKVAEASGGVLGYLTVSREEAQLMDLKMINNPE